MKRLIIEIGRTSIRALAADGSPAKPRIRGFAVQASAGEPSPEVLKLVLSRLALSKPEIMSVLPREQILTRLLKLPTIQPDELAKMVSLTGKAQLPYPPEQTVIDYQVLDQQAGSSNVQLVACHRDLVERHLSVLRQAGYEPTVVTPSSWGLLAWYQRLAKSPQVTEPAIVVHLDTDRTDFVLIKDARVHFSRSLSQGIRDWQETPEGFNTVIQELERTVASLRKELPGVEPQSAVLTGIGPLENWRPLLAQRLNIPVVVVQPSGRIALPTEASKDASPAVLLGLAMAEPEWLVNLVPSQVRQTRSSRRRIRELVITGSLLFCALLAGAGLLQQSVGRKARFVEQLLGAVKQLERATSKTEHRARNVQLVKQITEARHATATMLAELFRLTPQDVWFDTVLFERSRDELIVRGNAPTTRQVLDYIRTLEQSPHWRRVELRFSARRNSPSGPRTDFEIVLHRKEAPEAES